MLDLTIVIIFLLANLSIGYLSSRKVVNFSHFSVGHRSFSAIIIFCTLSATFIGGGYTIGNAAKVYSDGMIYAFALLGFSLKEILVAKFVAPRMDKFNDCHSVGEIMEKNYGVVGKVITGIFSLLICGGILGAQVGALGAILGVTVHINTSLAVFISFAVLVVYSTLGGMRAVVFTDVLQFLILVIGIPLTFFIGLHQFGGWQKLTAAVPVEHLNFLAMPHGLSLFIILFITFVFGETLVPPYVQRLFMSKSSKSTQKGTLASGLVSIPIFLISGAIGLLAYAFNQHLAPNDAFPYLVQHVLPIGLRGFVIAALLSIILSSAAGFLNAASIAFITDLLRPSDAKKQSKQLLSTARISTLIVGVISIIFALALKNVLDILLAAYNFWSPIIIVPLLAVIFGMNSKLRDFISGASAGIIVTLIWQFVLHTPWHITPLLVGIVANLGAFVASYQLRKWHQ